MNEQVNTHQAFLKLLDQFFQEAEKNGQSFTWSFYPENRMYFYQKNVTLESSLPSSFLVDLAKINESESLPLYYWLDPNSSSEPISAQRREILALGGKNILPFFKSQIRRKSHLPLDILRPLWDKNPSCFFFFNQWFFLPPPDVSHSARINSREWDDFSPLNLFLPHLLLQRKLGPGHTDRKLSLTLTTFITNGHTRSENSEGILNNEALSLYSLLRKRLLQAPELPPNKETSHPSPIFYSLHPQRSRWEDILKAGQGEMTTSCQKFVLARKLIYHFGQKLSPADLLKDLWEQQERTYLFYFSPQKGRAFLGRTPERLFYQNGPYLYSESIAGTRPRGQTPEMDEILAHELISSPKELKEHQLVSQFIGNSMRQLCSEWSNIKQNQILKLNNLQHIHSTFQGKIKPEVELSQILATFHPTPAVGGYPVDWASSFLAQNESFQRGYYAAPFGWCHGQEAEFLVGIRSCLVHEQKINFFAGAGIVAESKADEEWEETRNKLNNLSQLFKFDFQWEKIQEIPYGKNGEHPSFD